MTPIQPKYAPMALSKPYQDPAERTLNDERGRKSGKICPLALILCEFTSLSEGPEWIPGQLGDTTLPGGAE